VSRSYYAEWELAAGSPIYYGVDQLGSVRRAFVSTSNAPAYAYDPYGNPLQATTPMTDFGYAGLMHNLDSGLDLATFRAYDPVSGRWLSRDPMGEIGGINLYVYVQGNPLIYIDPLGLAWQLVIGGGGTVIVPFFGGGLNLNAGVNLDGWNSSVYIQGQANLGTPTAGGAFLGAGLGWSVSHADAPTTGFSSAPYVEGDAGFLGSLGASATGNGCGDMDFNGAKGLKPGLGLGLGAFAGITHTATAVSPTIGSILGH
jgi:RHS repeat-associated protein